jgi:hypothetical protein
MVGIIGERETIVMWGGLFSGEHLRSLKVWGRAVGDTTNGSHNLSLCLPGHTLGSISLSPLLLEVAM